MATVDSPTSLTKAAFSFVNKSLNAMARVSDAIYTAFGPTRPRDSDSKNYDEPQSHVARLINVIPGQIKRGSLLTFDTQIISAALDALTHSDAIDDRKMLLEHVFTLMSRLPDGRLLKTLQNRVISLLYNDLSHPQTSYVGRRFAWRSADGSGNNPTIPDLGRANTPYARSVQQQHPVPASQLPDASLVFDALLKREKFVPHPAGISSMLFAFAILIIHSVFHTSHDDWSINKTSSYLDLSPLYGTDQKTQDAVRRKDGRGMLLNDVFSEKRVLLLPPAAAALLVVFNRNHQYIATKIFEINERGTFVSPEQLDETRMLAQDDEIFNTARLINCGHFMSIIFGDYLSTILGTVREGLSFSLQPLDQIRGRDHTMVERGRGNVCSVEFNLLYRWHASISQTDEIWTKSVFSKNFVGRSSEQISMREFIVADGVLEKKFSQADVTTWTFGNLKRQPDGRFKDEDLSRILQDATQNVAGAFKARGIPDTLRVVEILGIEQARAWGVCTLNEFRKFLSLKPYSSFLEWNGDPEIAETAMRLYGDIDNLELYVGLMAEDPKPVVPGAGLCPGYTISRAILSDAVALTRGDRYFTTDYTPYNLTAWGFTDTTRDTTNPGFGSHLGRLFLRTLEPCYSFNSSYTWFPFSTPDAMKGYLTRLNVEDKYDYARPTMSPIKIASAYNDVASILQDGSRVRNPCVDSANTFIQGHGYLLSLDEPSRHHQDSQVIKSTLFNIPDALNNYATFYYTKTRELIEDRCFQLAGTNAKHIDIVRDVLNIVPIHWLSTKIVGLPLKSNDNPNGTLLEQQLYQMLKEIFSCIFLEMDPSKAMRMKENAQNHTKTLLGYIKAHLHGVTRMGFPFARIINALSRIVWPQQISSHEFYERLNASGRPLDELANDVYSIVVLASVGFSQALIHVVNFYLDDDRAKEKDQLFILAHTDDLRSELQLDGYIREALRIDPPFPGIYRVAKVDQEVGSLQLKERDRLYLSLVHANMDSLKFPSPEQVDAARPKEGYLEFMDGIRECLGEEFVSKTMIQVVRAIFSLRKVRRAAGRSGMLKRSAHLIHGTRHWQYVDHNQQLTPWPSSMVIQFDP